MGNCLTWFAKFCNGASSPTSTTAPRRRPPPERSIRAPSLPALPPPDIGYVLQRPVSDVTKFYDLDKELGRGQFGVTYLCTERATGRKFACKSISKWKLVGEAAIGDVRREVMILQHLSGQPNVVEFKGAFEDEQRVCLVMELCSGGELFDRISKRGSYSEKAAAVIMRQVVNVVNACHFMGVIHRDLKPENFLMVSRDEDSPIKATDFGLSVFIEGGRFFYLYVYIFN